MQNKIQNHPFLFYLLFAFQRISFLITFFPSRNLLSKRKKETKYLTILLFNPNGSISYVCVSA